MNYYVYEIKIGEVRRYIGVTNNIKRRQTEHNRGIKVNHKKMLYQKLRELEIIDIKIEPIANFKNKIDANRFEAMIILEDFFSSNLLWQKVPFKFRYY